MLMQLYLEKCLSSCLSYRFFVTFLSQEKKKKKNSPCVCLLPLLCWCGYCFETNHCDGQPDLFSCQTEHHQVDTPLILGLSFSSHTDTSAAALEAPHPSPPLRICNFHTISDLKGQYKSHMMVTHTRTHSEMWK